MLLRVSRAGEVLLPEASAVLEASAAPEAEDGDDDRFIFSYSQFQDFITEKQREQPDNTLKITHCESGLFVLVKHGCVIDVSNMPVATDSDSELFVMWGRFALSTTNHAIDIPIEAKMPALLKPSRMTMFSLMFFLWFFAGAAAMKAFTAGLGLLIPYSEEAAFIYAVLVSAVTTLFYEENLSDAHRDFFGDSWTLVHTLNTGSNNLYCQLAPPPEFYSLRVTGGERAFQGSFGLFHGLAQFGMVAAAWSALGDKDAGIPFGNPYFVNSVGSALILANVAVGFNKSSVVYRLLKRYKNRWFGDHSEASTTTFKFTVLAMRHLDEVMVKSRVHFNLAELRNGILQRLVSLTHALQGVPKLEALLVIAEFYIEYLELATTLLSVLQTARLHIQKRYDFEQVQAQVKQRIFQADDYPTYLALFHARHTLLIKLSTWLSRLKKLIEVPLDRVPSTDIVDFTVRGEVGFFEWYCLLLEQQDSAVSINTERGGEPAHEETPLLLSANPRSQLASTHASVLRTAIHHHLPVCIEVPVEGYWSTTFAEFLGLALSIIPVKPNIDGVASLLEGRVGEMLRYVIATVGSVGPVGLNYESVMKSLVHGKSFMNQLVYRQGEQPSMASKWLGRFLSFLASAVVYYSFQSYGLSPSFSLSEIDHPLFWLKASCLLISWWLIIDTKSTAMYRLFESLLQKMGCIRKVTFKDDQDLFHRYLINKMQTQLRAIAQLVGHFRSLQPERVLVSRIVGEFPSSHELDSLLTAVRASTVTSPASSGIDTSMSSNGDGPTGTPPRATVEGIVGNPVETQGAYHQAGDFQAIRVLGVDHNEVSEWGYERFGNEYVFNEDRFWRELNKLLKNPDGLLSNAARINKAYQRILRFVECAQLMKARVLQDNSVFGASFFRRTGGANDMTRAGVHSASVLRAAFLH